LTGQTSALRESGKKYLQHQSGLLDESGKYRVFRVMGFRVQQSFGDITKE